jgi:hypothetical protein
MHVIKMAPGALSVTAQASEAGAVQVMRRHHEQSMQLLKLMRKVDLLEARFAAATGHWPQQQFATAELERQLSALEAEVGPSASGKLQASLF